MYVPAPFAVAEHEWMLEFIGRHPFGVLVTGDDPHPAATHVPMLVRRSAEGIRLIGHVAAANPQARAIAAGAAATAVFTGPHAYVSASWYEEPHRNVPTWNYSAVHAAGRLQEADRLSVLRLLEAWFEDGRPEPWCMADADPAYLERQLRGIVAFELHVERLDAARKLGQNRSAADRARVVAQLERSAHDAERRCAADMRCAHEGSKPPPG